MIDYSNEFNVARKFTTLEGGPSTSVPEPKSSVATRAGALAVLIGVALLVVYLLYAVYRVATDAFVAPMILSADSEVVLDHKQKVMELDGQRALAKAQAESIDAALSANEQAEKRLIQLQGSASSALNWTSEVNNQQASAGTVDLGALAEQRALLTQMLHTQQEVTDRARANFEASLITQGEYDKELQNLHQAELALLENRRAKARAEAAMGQVMLGKKSLAGGDSPAMPELSMRAAQMTQVQLELWRIQSDKQSQLAEKRVLTERITKIEELEAQLRARPIFRAMEKNLYAAFVPYTQLDGLKSGASVYRCAWGIFNCQRVGKVAEIVPGEVTMPDPWGTPARGQYIMLNLDEPRAAMAKVLRVRSTNDGV